MCGERGMRQDCTCNDDGAACVGGILLVLGRFAGLPIYKRHIECCGILTFGCYGGVSESRKGLIGIWDRVWDKAKAQPETRQARDTEEGLGYLCWSFRRREAG